MIRQGRLQTLTTYPYDLPVQIVACRVELSVSGGRMPLSHRWDVLRRCSLFLGCVNRTLQGELQHGSGWVDGNDGSS